VKTPSTTPAWAEISLSALRKNYLELKKLAGDSEILPVVKANAYGHGLVPIGKTLVQAGAPRLGVAFVQEGAALRKAGLRCPILVLTPTLPPEIPILLNYRLTPQVSSAAGAVKLAAAARKRGIKNLSVHVKLDTGMNRVGFKADDAVREISRLGKIKGLRIEALYTHLATADWTDPKYAWKQIALFKQALEKVGKIPFFHGHPPSSHAANSAALLTYFPEAKGTWARPGLALYGIYPNPKMIGRARLTPVMQVKTRIIHIKTLDKGESVSYGRTYTAKKRIRLATLGMGYADGLLRSLSNKGVFLIRGKRVPQVGTVCMDMTMADVSKIPAAKVGDTATFFGRDGGQFLSVEEQAARAGTISYEILCAVGERVARVYTR
jgi:alanine racemase